MIKRVKKENLSGTLPKKFLTKSEQKSFSRKFLFFFQEKSQMKICQKSLPKESD